MDAALARRAWRAAEALHAFIYFVPEAKAAYGELGVTSSRMGYFASRSAPMGAVSPEVVTATFYNFSPALVSASIPAAWTVAPPAAFSSARLVAADRALRRGLGDLVTSKELESAATLLKRAALAACEYQAGRPLFAGHAGLSWPDEPHLVAFHAQSLLREFRGDGHIAALVDAELSPVESLVSHEASGTMPPGFLQGSRAWDDEAWTQGIESLRSRGLITNEDRPTLSEAGRILRNHVEARTDALSIAPYAALGEAECETLCALARPVSEVLVDAGLLLAVAAHLDEED